MTRLVVGLLALTACGSAPALEPDRAHYLASTRVPLARAEAECAAIREVRLRDECRVQVAARGGRERDQGVAERACGAVDDPFWREECWFLAADELDLIGDDAVRWCRDAGRYRSNCLGHAIGREVREIERRYGKVGQERSLLPAIDEVVQRYKPQAPPEQRAVTTQTLAARIVAARWDDRAFDAELCGKVDAELCMRAYRATLDATPPEIAIEGLCEGGVALEEVLALGARGWTPGAEELATRTWAQLCEDVASGLFARDGSMGMGLGGAPPPPRPDVLPGERVAP